jgi:hypothetical protein
MYRKVANGMKKAIFAVLAAALLLLCCACDAGEPQPYAVEHEHVWGFWYDSDAEGEQIRYCRICGESQTQACGE